MTDKEWRDPEGFIHTTKFPTILGSENGPLFTGMDIVFKDMNGELTMDDSYAFFDSLDFLCRNGKWYTTTSMPERVDFSMDNWRGVWAAVLVIKKRHPVVVMDFKYLIDQMPLFHKQLLHPVSFAIVLKAKYGWNILNWITKFGFMTSARETHKTRGDRKIAKTEGKFIALCLCYAFGWGEFMEEFSKAVLFTNREYPLPINNKNVYKNDFAEPEWYWGSWTNLLLDYFPVDGHPLPEQISKWENI